MTSPEDAALRVQKKCIAAFARLQLLNLVGGHGVQQARAIFTGGDDFSAGGEIDPSGSRAEGLVAGVVGGEDGGGALARAGHTSILVNLGQAGRVPGHYIPM